MCKSFGRFGLLSWHHKSQASSDLRSRVLVALLVFLKGNAPINHSLYFFLSKLSERRLVEFFLVINHSPLLPLYALDLSNFPMLFLA